MSVVIHYRILISGKVQGVFYRASAQQKAEELNLKGFAQNLSNGDVLIEAEGNEAALKKLIDWCHQGPPRAQVSSVQVHDGAVQGYLSFTIKR